jgi:DDE superfamily endonuclease
VNVIGAYFTHGPCAGRFVFETCASVPQSRAKKPRKGLEEIAQQHGLCAQELGKIDAERFVRFVWRVAGRPPEGASDWKRERPLCIVLDNYSVHKSQRVQQEIACWQRADVHLLYLPSYSPELSQIEPVWNDVKYHEMQKRSYDILGQLKRAAEEALQCKADKLLAARCKAGQLLQPGT